jgi:hypothetical protein
MLFSSGGKGVGITEAIQARGPAIAGGTSRFLRCVRLRKAVHGGAGSAELFFNSAACNLWAMSRLRRLVNSDRYFFVTCNLRHTRTWLEGRDFEILARVVAQSCPLTLRLVRW